MIGEKKYYPQLDVIRGLSLIAVFFFHAYHPKSTGTLIQNLFVFFHSQLGLGLDVFFILSSFLLTYLGITEYQLKGTFSFKKYFIRRILRIWPLYFLFIILSFFVVPMLASRYGVGITMPPVYYYVFFIANFYLSDHVFFLRILWTLSIEEQFYLFWGICLLFFQAWLRYVIAIIALISIVFNLVQAANEQSVYFHTITYLIDMMAGAYAAYCLINKNFFLTFIRDFASWKRICFYLFLPVLFTAYYFMDKIFVGSLNYLLAVFVKLIFVSYVAILILDQMVNDTGLFRLRRIASIAFIGKISYGLYVFHGLIITVGLFMFPKFSFRIASVWQAIILFGITFIVALCSYYLVERPFLKMKSRFKT